MKKNAPNRLTYESQTLLLSFPLLNSCSVNSGIEKVQAVRSFHHPK
jgi:hypothetical protein